MMSDKLHHRGIASLLLLCALLGSAALLAGNVLFAPLNQDEGWYLMAAREVSTGSQPFIDFATTQGPVLPYVYAAFQPLIEHYGLLGGRMITAGFALLTLLNALLCVRQQAEGRDAKRWASVLLVIFIGINCFHAQYTTTVKTYGLAGCLLVLAFLSLIRLYSTQRTLWAILAGILIALAAGTRLSLGAAFVPVGLSLLFQRDRAGKLAWLYFGTAGLAGPFLLTASEQVHFGLLEFHGARCVENPLLMKAGFVSRFVQSYFVLSMVALALVLRRFPGRCPICACLWWTVALISLVHVIAPFPYDDYQTAVIPLLAIVCSTAVTRSLPTTSFPTVTSFVLLASLAAAGASPVLQDWFVIRQDRIWFQTKTQSDLHRLRDTAKSIRAHYPDMDTLLTQDLYLAIEGGWDVPNGFEMGPFSFAPELSRERAETLHLMNIPLLSTFLDQSDLPELAAISGYGFNINAPSIQEISPAARQEVQRLIQRHYQFLDAHEDFGQQHTRLEIYVRKDLGGVTTAKRPPLRPWP